MTDREGARDRSILNAKQRLYDRHEVLRFGVVGAGVLGAGSLLTACSSATTEHNKVRTGNARRYVELRPRHWSYSAGPGEIHSRW